MHIGDISFEGFIGRKEGLGSIARWHKYDPMFYRTSVEDHVLRVFYLFNEVLHLVRSVFSNFDEQKALLMTLTHDDSEIVEGDFNSGNWRLMDHEQKMSRREQELKFIDVVARRHPQTLHGHNYREMLLEMFHLQTIESQIVKYIDRFDAFGEGLHEVFAGNKRFVYPPHSEFGQLVPPTLNDIERYNNHRKDYHLITPLILKNHGPFLDVYPTLDIHAAVEIGVPHSRESFGSQTGYHPY